MTCDEFRKMAATDADLWSVTPIERAKCGNHYVACPLCQIWISLQLPDDGTKGGDAAIELCHSDLQDPEVREIALRGDE